MTLTESLLALIAIQGSVIMACAVYLACVVHFKLTSRGPS